MAQETLFLESFFVSLKGVIFVSKRSTVAQNQAPLGISGSSPLTRTLEARETLFFELFSLVN